MIEEKITISKSVRVYLTGQINKETETIWIAFHGYGQLGGEFAKQFEKLSNSRRVFIIPEAPHKFYLKFGGGDVGTSWMTKEDRLNEIADLNNYINLVYKTYNLEKYKVNVIGFSQGTATACRWLASSNAAIERLMLFGGTVPRDVDLSVLENRLKEKRIELYIGNKDRIVNEEFIKSEFEYIKLNNIGAEFKTFDGGHEIDLSFIKKNA